LARDADFLVRGTPVARKSFPDAVQIDSYESAVKKLVTNARGLVESLSD
jgi:hypothetical protein